MTTDPGTYALLLHATDEPIIEVGVLGEMSVHAGVYVYVGSAFGSGGLRARVERHIRNDGALHWHIDYLRSETTLEAVWYTHDPERRECTWAEVLRLLSGASVPVEGFGASDCTCPAHLARFQSRPSSSTFQARVHERCPGHDAVMRLEP